MKGIHWFRSDLRLEDNASLAYVSRVADEVIPLFVVDDHLVRKLDPTHPRWIFMLDCLRSLRHSLRATGSDLVVLRGQPAEVICRLCAEHDVALVSWNRDYSPYAKRRDRDVEDALRNIGVRTQSFKDRVGFEAAEVRKNDGGAFRIFTPYKRRWRTLLPQLLYEPGVTVRSRPCPEVKNQETQTLAEPDYSSLLELPAASESAAKGRLVEFLQSSVGNYEAHRDYPDRDGTSRLSAYLRFGVISIRTCLKVAKDALSNDSRLAPGLNAWVDQLIWRDFYHCILDEFPTVLRGPFKAEYANIQWDNNETHFRSWCEGTTGYPFIDAAMRQLNRSGWMHNRARMVVASFLSKDLLIDWRWGESYFMARLIDGDPASNNGGWQWAASTGTDAQPYFRIFNPTLQGQKFDPLGGYVKRWVDELADIPAKNVHYPHQTGVSLADYPMPIVDHKSQRLVAIERYKASHSSPRRG